MKVSEVLEKIFNSFKIDDLVVSSCGRISKRIYLDYHRKSNFYMVGTMGAALPFSLGLALNTKKQVHCIVGDGDLLSCLGSLVQKEKLKLQNHHLYILDNGCYGTTGGQPTISPWVDYYHICVDNIVSYQIEEDKTNLPPVQFNYQQIKEDFYEAVNSGGKKE